MFTSRRATVVVAALSLFAIALQAITRIVVYFHGPAFSYIDYIYKIIFFVVLPSTVLVINLILVREVRRASHSAAANLGLQQSTSSNSAIPTIMLITTSLVYVFLMSPYILWSLLEVIPYSAWCDESWGRTLHITKQFVWVTFGLFYAVFAYNFFVYVITSKQFRCELRQLCCCANSSNELAAVAAAAAVRTPRHRAVADV